MHFEAQELTLPLQMTEMKLNGLYWLESVKQHWDSCSRRQLQVDDAHFSPDMIAVMEKAMNHQMQS